MMIEDQNPRSWRTLQEGVARIFREIGLTAETDVLTPTPRGEVSLDVLAVDKDSVDQIRYVVECKNWSKAVPQTVVHAFSTVMQEVGANVGYIVSKKGLQAGAVGYTNYTNITGLTYGQFQERYFRPWFERYFVPTLGNVVDPLSQYVEPFNSFRDRRASALSPSKQKHLRHLQTRYQRFGIAMAFFEFPRYSKQFTVIPPRDIATFKEALEKNMGWKTRLKAVYFRELLRELLREIGAVTDAFDDVFDGRIFK